MFFLSRVAFWEKAAGDVVGRTGPETLHNRRRRRQITLPLRCEAAKKAQLRSGAGRPGRVA